MYYFCYFLTAIFIGLKLAGFITWSWWLVLLPALIAVGVSIPIVVFAFIVATRRWRGGR